VGNDDKLWIQENLSALAHSRAVAAIQSTGRALPCQVTAVDGSIVTVTFEVVGPWTLPDLTLPKAESQWLRTPTQVGDFGMTMPADTFLGGISGLGTGVADLGVEYGNLSTLVFMPVAATSFRPAPDPDQAWVNGPAGAVLSDTAQTASVTVSDSLVTIVAGGQTWTFSAAGLTMSTGVVAETHLHGGVTTGGAETLEPIA
jgi:hypothetical protein